MDKSTLRIIAQDRIFALSGDEFQDFIDRLCLKMHPGDYQPVRAGGNKGDMKNDGYCPNARVFYAAHATRSATIDKLKRKMYGDLSGCIQHHTNVQKWVFLSNDDKFVGEIETYVDEELRPAFITQSSNLREIQAWGGVRIVDEMARRYDDKTIFEILRLPMSNPQHTQENVFQNGGSQFANQTTSIGQQIGTQINNSYINGAQRDNLNYVIINELLSSVLSFVSTDSISIEEFEFVKVSEKIAINFVESDVRDRIKEQIISGYEFLPLVNKAYTALSSFDQKCIKHQVNTDYSNLKSRGIENEQIFSELSQRYNIRKNEHYNFLSLCMVVYFFDDCSIFERTKQEKMVQGSLL